MNGEKFNVVPEKSAPKNPPRKSARNHAAADAVRNEAGGPTLPGQCAESRIVMQTSPVTLELEDHRRFHLGFWRIQRLAWIAFGLIVVASLAGFAGAGGPMSRQTTSMAGGEADHPRVGRWSAADEIRLRLNPGAGEREVLLSSGFADHFMIEDIQPTPSRDIAAAGGHRLVFDAEAGQPVAIILHVRAEKPGIAEYAVGLDGAPPRSMRSIILP